MRLKLAVLAGLMATVCMVDAQDYGARARGFKTVFVSRHNDYRGVARHRPAAIRQEPNVFRAAKPART